MTRLLAILTLAVGMMGCGPDANITMNDDVKGSNRYKVTRVAVFEDSLAYDRKRGIYEITDRESGRTYLGFSGIGICEVARHPVGKTSMPDER